MGTVLHLKTQIQADESVTAVVVFLDPALADIAVQRFNGAVADGQVLKAETRRIYTGAPSSPSYYPSWVSEQLQNNGGGLR